MAGPKGYTRALSPREAASVLRALPFRERLAILKDARKRAKASRCGKRARPLVMRFLRTALAGGVALLLGGCAGSGCLPGDFISTCARSCGGRVLVAQPVGSLCVCAQPAPESAVPAPKDGGQ